MYKYRHVQMHTHTHTHIGPDADLAGSKTGDPLTGLGLLLKGSWAARRKV